MTDAPVPTRLRCALHRNHLQQIPRGIEELEPVGAAAHVDWFGLDNSHSRSFEIVERSTSVGNSHHEGNIATRCVRLFLRVTAFEVDRLRIFADASEATARSLCTRDCQAKQFGIECFGFLKIIDIDGL
jgi:hypothetical protein